MPNSHHDRKDEKFLEILKDLMDIHMLCPITDLVNNDDRIILKNNPYTMLFYIIEIIIVFLSKVKSDFTKLHVIWKVALNPDISDTILLHYSHTWWNEFKDLFSSSLNALFFSKSFDR